MLDMVLVWCYTWVMKRRAFEARIPINARYPRDVYCVMHLLAEYHHRSLNEEVMWALRLYIQQSDEQSQGEAQGRAS